MQSPLINGHQAFDITKLAKIAETSDQGSLNTPEEQQDHWESVYDVEFPNVMTLEEFAMHVNEFSLCSGG